MPMPKSAVKIGTNVSTGAADRYQLKRLVTTLMGGFDQTINNDMRKILNWWRWGWPTWKEKAILAIVWRLPRQIVYWSAIRVATYKNAGSPDDRSVSDMLKAWKA